MQRMCDVLMATGGKAIREVPGLAYGGSIVRSLAAKQIEEEITEQQE